MIEITEQEEQDEFFIHDNKYIPKTPIICSWCNQHMGYKNMIDNPTLQPTHGMCVDCFSKGAWRR